MITPLPQDKERLLVLEGPGDQHVFRRYLEYLGWSDKFHLLNCGGKENLSNQLSNVLNDDNFANLTRIGIVCDNDYPEDRNGKSGFEIVLDYIVEANTGTVEVIAESRLLPVPKRPRQLIGEKPKLSVFLLPSDDLDGSVEDLIFKAVRQDNVMDCVNAYFRCLTEAGLNARKARLSKSKLSVYISGKVIDTQFANHDDAKRQFLTQAVDMKWWNEENMWE